jgi:hypothetical protein
MEPLARRIIRMLANPTDGAADAEAERRGVMVFRNPRGPLLSCGRCQVQSRGRCAVDSDMDARCPECNAALG